MLTYSINIGWRGVCPGCAGVTMGENVTDTPRVDAATTRIYAVCDACGWEGPGVPPGAPPVPPPPTISAA